MTQLDAVFAALSDPTRRAILARLATEATTVGKLAAPFAISGPAISRHLRVLERAHLISTRRDGQHRVCRLDPRGLSDANAWIEAYRRFWTTGLDRLDDHLNDNLKGDRHE